MMHEEDLHAMSIAELRDYLRERFYGRHVDPPADDDRLIPLEAFPISAFRSGGDAFKARFHEAVRDLLLEWNRRAWVPVPEEEDAYFGRLAFLTFSVLPGQPEVYEVLRTQADLGRVGGNPNRFSEDTEWHLLAALAYLQQPDALDHFWRRAWHVLPARFWGAVYDGMRRADPGLALTLLSSAVDRARQHPDEFCPGPVWARILVHVPGGPEKLARAARHAGRDAVKAVTEALEAVEPPAEPLGRFTAFATGTTPPTTGPDALAATLAEAGVGWAALYTYIGAAGFGLPLARLAQQLRADASARQAVERALREGLRHADARVAATSAALLAQVEDLPAKERAHVAVRAFDQNVTRPSGVDVVRSLLDNPLTREVALEALKRGLHSPSRPVSDTSRELLADAERARP